MIRIFIGQNYLGAGNFGDDLTLAGFLRVAQRYPGAEISACTAYDLAGCRRRFPQIRWFLDDEAAREEALRTADLWLALGDTPFQLDCGPWLLDHNERERRRCAAFRKPMYLLGVGCESREAAADGRSRALLAAAEHIWARDERSAAMLRPFVRPPRLSAGADLANLAFDGAAPPAERDVVGLLLAFERREQFDPHEIARFVERREPRRTRWLVQEVRALPYLERRILAMLGDRARSRLTVMDLDGANAAAGDFLRAFGAPEVTVTSRYHGALIGAWHGSRVLVVARSQKLRGIADDLELPRIERLTSHTALEAAVATAQDVPRDRLHALRARARRMCQGFFENVTSERLPLRAPALQAPSASRRRRTLVADPLRNVDPYVHPVRGVDVVEPGDV